MPAALVTDVDATIQAIDDGRFTDFGVLPTSVRLVDAESLGRGVAARFGADVVIDEIFAPVSMLRNRSPVSGYESQRVVGFLHDAEGALVQQPMVIRAEQRHVLRRCVATIDPVFQVMSGEIPFAMATGERAASVARVERSAQRR